MAAKGSYYYIKLYYTILDNHQVGYLPDSLKWRFIQCLLAAGEEREDGFLPDMEPLAFRLRLQDASSLAADLTRLAAAGLVELAIDGDGQERWYVTNWLKYQSPVSDAERMRAYRARQAKERVMKRMDNDPVTEPLRYRNVDLNNIKDINDKGMNTYTEPLPEPQADMITAITQICKTTFWAKTRDQFEEAALILIGWDAQPADLAEFQQWWTKAAAKAKDAGKDYPYPGRPALKSIMEEWHNFTRAQAGNLDDLPTRPGEDFKVFDEVENG